VLRSLERLKVEVFKEKNLKEDPIKEVYNMITTENQSGLNLYLERSRFIAGPTLPGKSTARPAMILAISFLFGLFLSIVLIFGYKWSRKNMTQQRE
jgi:hypothetical protein